MRRFLIVSAVATLATSGFAQTDAPGGMIAPLPGNGGENLQRIAPENPDPRDSDILTTKHGDGLPSTAPFKKAGEPEGAAIAPVSNPASAAPAAPAASPFATYNGKSPFQHAEPQPAAIPSGPHAATAVPVGDVDAVEASEPAPPTPVAPQADPAKEDPAEPTELTSPIFEPQGGTNFPRKMILRVLNKVTGQSQLITLKPGENIMVGQLQITGVTCQTSVPRSQTDYAALIDISEQKPGEKSLKQLFRGWMYASSPSITSLEHPVYDVTMVQCDINQPVAKDDKKVDDATKNPSKKAKK